MISSTCREKQKQVAQEKKEKRKTQKGERRRQLTIDFCLKYKKNLPFLNKMCFDVVSVFSVIYRNQLMLVSDICRQQIHALKNLLLQNF